MQYRPWPAFPPGAAAKRPGRTLAGLLSLRLLLLSLTLSTPGPFVSALDVHFDDPTSGFFVRERVVASSSSSSSGATSGHSSLSNALPTTSIILGGGGGGGELSPTTSSGHRGGEMYRKKAGGGQAKDIIHSASLATLRRSQPLSIHAEYGPFHASQTLPTQYILPDVDVGVHVGVGGNRKKGGSSQPQGAGLVTNFKPHALDLSAHLVTKEITKDKPVLRVLFHAGRQQAGPSSAHSAHSAGGDLNGNSNKLCIFLFATSSNQTRQKAHCSPGDNRDDDTTCLAEVTLPSSWWPSLAGGGPAAASNVVYDIDGQPTKGPLDERSSTTGAGAAEAARPPKQPKVAVSVSYAVYEAKGRSCGGEKAPHHSLTTVVPETPLSSKVPLTFPQHGYRQLGHDSLLHLLLPQAPIYPNSKMFVPVFLQPQTGYENQSAGYLTAVTIKCRTRSGIKLLGVEESSSLWSTRVEMNPRGTMATVTAFRKHGSTLTAHGGHGHRDRKRKRKQQQQQQQLLLEGQQQQQQDNVGQADQFGPHELFNFLFSVDGDRDYEVWNQGKLTFQVSYRRHPHQSEQSDWSELTRSANETSDLGTDSLTDAEADAPLAETSSRPQMLDHYRIRAKIDIQKDDVQAVLPIAKHSELMNLAQLTGRQVARSLKIFIVSEAGKIADVTLRSSCTSLDDSVLKVSSSCTSVYVDGSESRGALTAGIQVRYGELTGVAQFTVWMAELPLRVELDDPRLSQVKDWRVVQPGGPAWRRGQSKKGKIIKREVGTFYPSQTGKGRSQCSPRYQQSQVRVFGRFTAEDPESGRKSFFPSRNAELDVTELLLKARALRVKDDAVATLRGQVVRGRMPGKTEVQVTSPISGEVIGRTELRVSRSKESIVGLNVRLLSGLHLNLFASEQNGGRGDQGFYKVQTTYSTQLNTLYQEGLLDIDLVFSDDSLIHLKDINPNDYHLTVKSLNPEVIAYAPSAGARHPRVIAVGTGRGNLLELSLASPDFCSTKGLLLGSTMAEVDVSIKGSTPPGPRDLSTAQAIDMGDLGDTLSNIALRDEQKFYQPSVSSARHYPTNTLHHPQHPVYMSPLEVGMFVLLGVFCVAIAIFVASCFIYASRYQKQDYPLQRKSRSIQNAHDWVWLGKSTIEKSSVHSSGSRDSLDDPKTSQVVRRNPENLELQDMDKRKSQRLSYVGSEINIIPNPQTEEYEAEVSNPNSPEESPQAESVEVTPLGARRKQLPVPPKPTPQQLYTNFMCQELPRRGGKSLRGARPAFHQYPGPPPGHPLSRRLPQTPIFQQTPRNVALRSPPTNHFGHGRAPPEYRLPIKRHSNRPQPQITGVQHRKPHQNLHPQNVATSTSPLQEMPQQLQQQRQRTPQQTFTPQMPLPQQMSSQSQAINSATYTKRDSASSPPRGVLPVGYPIFAATNMSGSALSFSSVDHDKEGQFGHRDPTDLSPLDLLPDPSNLVMPVSPIRQSPASALPPFSEKDDLMLPLEGEPGQMTQPGYEPVNPDIDRPSPPRHGAPRLFENPFNLTDEDSMPILPEKLSPNHIFEEGHESGQYMYPLKEEVTKEVPAKKSPQICTDTFVKQKSSSPAPENAANRAAGNNEKDTSQESTSNAEKEVPDQEDSLQLGMDYEQLMSYFESLKESTA